MQTILLSCMAAAIVLLCICVFHLQKRITRLSKRYEQKFHIQNQFNRYFNEVQKIKEPVESKKNTARFFANGTVLFFLISFLASCSPADQIPAAKTPNYSIVTIEGCEYFLYPVTHGYSSITHKGNCPNPIHHSSILKTEIR